jgi:hypothetical protein
MMDMFANTQPILAESMYEQVDSEGWQHLFFDSIVDHAKLPNAIGDKFIVSNGVQRPKQTTQGW